MRYSNLHTHSIYSDGYYTIEENIKQAIEYNFVSLGMSDHSPMPFPNTFGMNKHAVETNIREIRQLAEKYKDQIEVYVGSEYEGFSELAHPEEYDYLIGDSHFLYGRDGKMYQVDHNSEIQMEGVNNGFGGDRIAYAEAYFATYIEAQKKHKPDILGHFDLLTEFNNFPEDDPKYLSIAIEAVREAYKICPIFEINTGAIAKKDREVPYPSPYLIEEILRIGGKVMLSSDCHKKENLKFHFDEEIERLKAIGFKEIVQLKGGKFTEVGI